MESGSMLGQMSEESTREKGDKRERGEPFLFLGPGFALITTMTLAYNASLNPIGIEFSFCFFLMVGLFATWKWGFKGVFSSLAALIIYSFFFQEADSFREGFWVVGAISALFVNWLIAALGFEEASFIMEKNTFSVEKEKESMDQIFLNVKKVEKSFLDKELLLRSALEEERKKQEGYLEVLQVKNQVLEKIKKELAASEEKRFLLEKSYNQKIQEVEEKERALPSTVDDLYQENAYYKNKILKLESSLSSLEEEKGRSFTELESMFKVKEAALHKTNQEQELALSKLKEELSSWQRRVNDIQGMQENLSSQKNLLEEEQGKNRLLQAQIGKIEGEKQLEVSRLRDSILKDREENVFLKEQLLLLQQRGEREAESVRSQLKGDILAKGSLIEALEEEKRTLLEKITFFEAEKLGLLEKIENFEKEKESVLERGEIPQISTESLENQGLKSDELTESLKVEKRYQAMYLQLREQFKEKDQVLDEVRRELFHSTQKLLEKEKVLEETFLFGENIPDFIEKEAVFLSEIERQEKEISLMEELVSTLVFKKN